MRKGVSTQEVATPATKVKVARSTDAVGLGAFFMRAWREAGPNALGFTGAKEEDIRRIASREFLTKILADRKTRIVVAERGDQVLGFASVRKMSPRRAELSGVVVLGSEAGKGLGTKMVRRAFSMATRLGFKRLTVKTEAFNERAIRFYEKNGFAKKKKTTEKVGKTNVSTQVLEKIL